jgi:SAM-dependent methyltransferase
VLDFRSGWGRIALGLSEDFGLVVAAEVRYEMARLTALRAATAGVGNLQAVCLDMAQRLPFPPAFFDVAVLHEALEWGQPVLLHEVARVLKPGGWLFLMAANRLSPTRLFPPAWLQPSRWKRSTSAGALGGGERLFGWSGISSRRPKYLSLPGYQKALVEAGLQSRAVYAVLPSVTEPYYLVPLDGRGALRYLLDMSLSSGEVLQAIRERGFAPLYRLAAVGWGLARLVPSEWLLRRLTPAYGLLATKVH